MCDMNNDCKYTEPQMLEAKGPKDVYLHNIELDEEIRVPGRIVVCICPECGSPDWRTLGIL